MPNRVDPNINGIRPTVARQPAERADRPEQAAARAQEQQPAEAATPDRVELSAEAQARARTERPAAGGGDERRMAALNAPGAGEPEAAGRESGVTGPTQQRAEQIRQEQAARPRERQGNLVDVVG